MERIQGVIDEVRRGPLGPLGPLELAAPVLAAAVPVLPLDVRLRVHVAAAASAQREQPRQRADDTSRRAGGAG